MFKTVRHLNPRGCDRITQLIEKINSAIDPKWVKIIDIISLLANVKKDEAREKLNLLINRIEKQVAKNNFNFILKGIPNSAPLRETGLIENIGYVHMRDTLSQFGTISKLHIVNGTVYVKFTEPTSCVMCHSLINNMQIGENIVTSECI